MFTAETGGVLNQVHHLYAYRDMAHRAQVREGMSLHNDWRSFVEQSRPLVSQQVRHHAHARRDDKDNFGGV
jgi:hypothetical protein